mmetsp:Transcript_58599/g.67688  ORF Transcript_58599/g.67688 Transcript_58599/m.67688 type:complete len:175 (+) Transcript_58599:79-603(+)
MHTTPVPSALLWCPPSFLFWIRDELLLLLSSSEGDTSSTTHRLPLSVPEFVPHLKRILASRGIVSTPSVVEDAVHDDGKWFIALGFRTEVSSALRRLEAIFQGSSYASEAATSFGTCCIPLHLPSSHFEAQPVTLSEVLRVASDMVVHSSRGALMFEASDGVTLIGSHGLVLHP